jgi:hypothetical protein
MFVFPFGSIRLGLGNGQVVGWAVMLLGWDVIAGNVIVAITILQSQAVIIYQISLGHGSGNGRFRPFWSQAAVLGLDGGWLLTQRPSLLEDA